jgi:hypothetical protein
MESNYNKYIDDLLSGINLPSDEEIKEETARAKQAESGRRNGLNNVISGHLQKLGKSGIGGKTVTKKKLDKIHDLNKTKRKLTDEEVIEMKELYRNDITIGMDELSIKYGIDKVAVHWILNNKTYKDIGGTVTIRPAQLICEICGTHTNKSNYVRWHGEKCRNKK